MHIKRRKLILSGAAILGLSIIDRSFIAKADHFLQLEGDEADTGIEVINAGIGGNNTFDLLNRIDKDCLIHQPSVTVLMIGTNDMNSVKHVPIDTYEQNLKAIVKKIKATGSRILMMTILPTYEPYLLTRHPAAFYAPEGVEKRRLQVNEIIAKIAKQYKLDFLDLAHRFETIGKVGLDKDSLIQNEANSNKTDGIHPTANGYRFIALTVYDYLMLRQLPTRKIVCFGDSITKGDGSIHKNSYPAFLKKLLSTK